MSQTGIHEEAAPHLGGVEDALADAEAAGDVHLALVVV